MTETERVWACIKVTAQKFATVHRTLSPHSAEKIVSNIIREERAERPPPEALTYLAGELRTFITQYGRDGAVTESKTVR